MKINTYKTFVPISEQTEPATPRNPTRRDPSFYSLLIRQALLRSQVQSAISELIMGYEANTGSSVIRLRVQRDAPRVILEAIPTTK
jgi:hypothetical protein